jgi:glycosyltransferase involved in cell wall biosynthesis
MKILTIVGTDNASHFIRTVVPGSELRSKYGVDYRTTGSFNPAMFKKWDWTPDLVILQSVYTPEIVPMIRQVKDIGIPIIYDMDDDFWHEPLDLIGHEFHTNTVVELLRLADAASVSSEELVRITGLWAKKSYLVPNHVPDAYWEMARNQEKKHRFGEIVLGFFGGWTHERDLAEIAPALVQVLQKYPKTRLVLMGCAPEWTEPLNPVCIQRQPVENYFQIMSGMAVDIALAPLQDIQFNRSRSYLKLLEYGASGWPVIASPIGEFKKFKGAVDFAEQNWSEKLSKMVESPETRKYWADQLAVKVGAIGKISRGVDIWWSMIQEVSGRKICGKN